MGRRPTKLLAIAGMIGPVLFILVVVAQGILQPDYSHVAMPISALAAWSAGWMQNLNFFVAATLLLAFTVGLHATLRPTRYGVAGIGLLLAGCVGLFMAGLFPWINVKGVPTETPQHALAAILTFFGTSTGLIVLSRRIAADPRWHDLSTYVLATGVVMLLLFIVVGFFAIEEGTPFHRWTGFLQRVLVVVWFVCLLVMARRMLRLAREDELPAAHRPAAPAGGSSR
jgi:hypothetical membrane protein